MFAGVCPPTAAAGCRRDSGGGGEAGVTLYTFEVALAPPMFNFATLLFILQPRYLFTLWLFRLLGSGE